VKGAVKNGQADGSDATLADRLRYRDVGALEIIYARHARPVFSLALKMLADHGAAEEVVQETFLKLWQRPSSYLPERGPLLSWLLGVAHHRAVDRLRRRRLELRHTAEGRPEHDRDSSVDPEDELIKSVRGQAIQRALERLPVAQREAVLLAYMRGMTQVEIARALGEPLGTVKTRLRLALQKLRASAELAEMRSGSP
jgi:RNA polymerase sigma-70 factor, ECF subfamily